MADLKRAIAKMREYRATHENWAHHYDACDFCCENPPAYVDTKLDQLKIVMEYDNVLEILEELTDGS